MNSLTVALSILLAGGASFQAVTRPDGSTSGRAAIGPVETNPTDANAPEASLFPRSQRPEDRIRFDTNPPAPGGAGQVRDLNSGTSPRIRIVCGMTVIQADPKVDPAFIIPAPADRDFKIQRITPKVCIDSAAR
ncbi:MAG: hypothetical protein ACRD15_12160 [Vicinamibacterales bacterium]